MCPSSQLFWGLKLSQKERQVRDGRGLSMGKSTQIRGAGAVITPELRAGGCLGGGLAKEAQPHRVGMPSQPPVWALDIKYSRVEQRAESGFPSWLGDTGPVQRQQMQHSEADITKQSPQLFPLGLDSASEPFLE